MSLIGDDGLMWVGVHNGARVLNFYRLVAIWKIAPHLYYENTATDTPGHTALPLCSGKACIAHETNTPSKTSLLNKKST